MTFNDIITSINHKIENSTFEKFNLTQIIDELNNTYRDLAAKTSVFETTDYLILYDDNETYELPNRIHRPTRATYRGEQIDFTSQEQMDLYLPGWEKAETDSNLEYLVYNNLASRQVRVYPRLSNVTVIPTSDSIVYLGQLSEVEDTTHIYIYLNTLTGAKYLADVPHGTISDLNLTEIITIYGAYLPPKVVESNLDSEEIYIDEIYINALIYGTAGNLLFTSGRTEDISKGQMFMKLYGVDETDIAAIRKKDFKGGFRNATRQTYRTPWDK